jgi:hypothetical protein
MKYLKKAEALGVDSKQSLTSQAGTSLNICTVLSKLGRHAAALQNAKQALHKLLTVKDAGQPLTDNEAVSLVIAYYNVGVEAEACGSYNEAKRMYE